jgi:hypothetical protein
MLMQRRSISWHFIFALLVGALLFAFFTIFSANVPHPETLSPYAYLVATALCFWTAIQAKKAKAKNASWYFLLPLISLFGSLEEISYGAELGWFRPPN